MPNQFQAGAVDFWNGCSDLRFAACAHGVDDQAFAIPRSSHKSGTCTTYDMNYPFPFLRRYTYSQYSDQSLLKGNVVRPCGGATCISKYQMRSNSAALLI